MKPRLLISAALVVFAVLPAQAQIFGPSREEREAAAAHEAEQDAQIRANEDAIAQTQQQLQGQIRDLQDRVRNLTDSLARATGANEELGHQLGQLNNRLAQQERDFAYRLCVISAQQLGADAQSMNCAAAGTQSAAAQPQPQFGGPGTLLPPIMPNSIAPSSTNPGGNPNLGRGPGVLGTLSGSGAAPVLTPPQQQAAAGRVSGGGQSREFDSAMNLLARAQYNEASAAFRGYADTYADDQDLAPQALYWVGNIAYMQQDYAGASRAFAEAIKKYPKSPRSADSMLRMGQALVAQGQTSNGCTAFAAIAKQYPNAPQSTKTAATNARRAAKCG